MSIGQFTDAVGLSQRCGQLFVPKFGLLNETVFVHFHLVTAPAKHLLFEICR